MQRASISCFQEWQIQSAYYLLQHRTEQSQTLVMRYFQWLSHIELLRACYYLYRTRIWLTSRATGPIPLDAPEEQWDPFQGTRQNWVGILCLTILLLLFHQAEHFMIHDIHLSHLDNVRGGYNF
jgi:magnesium-transporting ATPase (P-type)